MFKWIASKVSSAVPKVVNAVKGAAKAVTSVVKKVVSAVPKMINAMKSLAFTFKDKMNKFLDNLDPDLQELLFGIERGKLGNEAIAFLSRWQFRLLDYGLKKLNQGIESVPWLSTIANAPGEAWKWVTDKASQGLTDFGRMVNDAEIPVVSDFVGSFTGVSEGNGSLASIYGAYGRGIWVKGVGGTIDGLMTIVTNPLESAQGVTHLVANADEMAPKIVDQVGEYVDKNLINGTAESRAEFAGQVVFEVATAVATCGGGTAAKGGVKGADTAVDVARMADKAGDVARAVDKASDAVKTTDKAGDAAKAADKAGDTAKVGESGVKIKGSVEEAKVKKVPEASSPFKYKNNPSENPKVLKDAVEDPNAVYGYRPRKDGSLSRFADASWDDPVKVEGYRQDRVAYHARNEGAAQKMVADMTAEGKSTEEIAREVNKFRNQSRIDAYIDADGNIKNMEGYKAALERTELRSYDNLIKAGKTPEQIIRSATKGNPGMDACVGLYDEFYSTY